MFLNTTPFFLNFSAQRLSWFSNKKRKFLFSRKGAKKKKITEKTKLASFEEWDSLGMLTVMSAIDKKIKGKVDINSFEKVKNIEDIVKIINKK